ncbi:EcsC family protein [Robbsia sp. Bb-Pol-6]|uniref:EcsC family protein n=1 Tax=Robbsia betulipollinis TaxID=2981849 RepID=A0ABT3ZL91_9BURK|nr:EcsC family protein [Robbsia betulipollinis]MCY0387308.1 EcsC family protein [Robbsia betulipollinis]
MMPLPSPIAPDHLDELRKARARLEHPGFPVKLASMVGAPVEKLLARLPNVAGNLVNDATRAALDKCLALALRTIRKTPVPSGHGSATAPGGAAPGTPAPHGEAVERTSSRFHKLAVAATGAAGGAFGFVSLPVELPVTTTLMFRSIGEIAQAYGEDLSLPDAQLQCLMVLAMGGPATAEDDASYGYFVVRGALAQTVASASAELAGKSAASHGSAFVTKLVHSVAARFSAQVGEQAAAKAIPVVGAVFGAAINTVFISHFQEMARGHFAIRRLERLYGEDAVRQAYERVGG